MGILYYFEVTLDSYNWIDIYNNYNHVEVVVLALLLTHSFVFSFVAVNNT